jgi:uncharacterized protein
MRLSAAFAFAEPELRQFQIVACTRVYHARAMPPVETLILLVTLTFVLAGTVKGVTGMGLPTVAMGLLGLLMAPAQAAGLLLIPSLVTNLWQFAAGPSRLALLRRMAPMLLAIGLATWLAAGFLTGADPAWATAALGLALMAYAALGFARLDVAIPKASEAWLSPLIGATTGIVTGATGVFVIPAVPYLQGLGLSKDDLVQALGLSFTASTLALAGGLASHGALHLAGSGASLLCTAPALAGMFLGQKLRAAADAQTFRRFFFLGLLLLGADLVTRGIL